jgi:hypothetical protein
MSESPNLEELIMSMRNANNSREQRVAAIQKITWCSLRLVLCFFSPFIRVLLFLVVLLTRPSGWLTVQASPTPSPPPISDPFYLS